MTEIELREKMEKAKNKYFDKLFQQEELIPEPGDMTLRDWDLSIPRSSRVRVRLIGWEDFNTTRDKFLL